MGDPSMNYWMGVKYGVQGQNAAAAQTGANAAMVGANGAYLQHVGERGLLDKQAGTWDADAAAKQYGLRTGADAAMQSANAAMTQAQADMERSRHQGALMDSEARLNSQRGSPLSGGALDFMGNNLDRGYLKPPGYAAGTANVQPQSPQYAAPASPETLGALWDHVNGYAAGTADVPAQGQPQPPQGQPQFNPVAAPAANWFLGKMDEGMGKKPAAQPRGQPQHYDQGTQRVPGKGSGMVDKVKALLAPGEAVLNKGAAEHFGRDNIAALNAIGHAKMVGEAAQGEPAAKPGKDAAKGPAHKAPEKPAGKGPAKPAPKVPEKGAKAAGGHSAKPVPAGKGKPQELAKGTHHVQAGKSAKTPQIDPQTLQALMGMMSQGGGGGGMPGGPPGAGGGGPPMPPPTRGGMV